MTTPARIWREIPQRYRLEAGQCLKCGKIHFPPKLICDACKGREFKTVNLPFEGTIETFTIIRVPPTPFSDEAPYAVGIVNLGGVKITTQIVDTDLNSIKIGQKVKVEFRLIQKDGEAGVLCYGYKCVPI